MFTELRKRTRRRRQRASLTRIITAASQPQRDELIVMAQRQGLL
jgi:preprotein translocase subunit Sss1